MKVKLLQITKNTVDVMWTAARTCYASESPIDIWDNKWGELSEGADYSADDVEEEQEKHWKLVQRVLNLGHASIAEHLYFTFAIEGVSRACSHQLTRHRAGIVFSQQSQRYVEIKEDFNTLVDLKDKELKTTEDERFLMETCQKYFVNVDANNYKVYLDTLLAYLYDTQINGRKAEDARAILPNATKTNLTMSCNYRELMHMCNLRLCSKAQKEIRDLFKAIVKEVKSVDERLAKYLVPQCEVNGFCKEHKCCGRKPTLQEVMDGYKKWEEVKSHIDKGVESANRGCVAHQGEKDEDSTN